jgi:hypothetical protein
MQQASTISFELARTKQEIGLAVEAVTAAQAKLASAVACFQAEVEECQAALAAQREADQSAFAERKKVLDEEAALLAQQASVAEDAVRRSGSRVRLNVGGQPFVETSRPTLLAEPGSMFYALIQTGAFLPDVQKGDFFIDRDPKLFGSLTYLRDNRRDGSLNLDLDGLFFSPDRYSLCGGIEYYQIDSLMDAFKDKEEGEVVFVGFAQWDQDNEPHRDQDALMNQAAANKFPGSRAATFSEYQGMLIKLLPDRIPDSEGFLTFTGEEGDDVDKAYDEGPYNCKKGILVTDDEGVYIEGGGMLDGTVRSRGMFAGRLSVICVEWRAKQASTRSPPRCDHIII